MDRGMKLVSGGSVIDGATPTSFYFNFFNDFWRFYLLMFRFLVLCLPSIPLGFSFATKFPLEVN